ncbi:MAG: sialate O-acetylesterase [Candidatus Brocadiia bacterium]
MTTIFLLAGQSNMVGAGDPDLLPENLKVPPADTQLFENDVFQETFPADHFGPEVGFAHEFRSRKDSEPLILCKIARGGANLACDWNPDITEPGPEDEYRGPMYPRLLEALQSVRSSVPEAKLGGMIWMQGERDSVFASMAEAYAENLRPFIARIREDTGVPDLPFILAQICPRMINGVDGEFAHRWRDIVRRAQARVARDTDCTGLVATHDLPEDDHLHYNTAGQIELGRRFAEEWFVCGCGMRACKASEMRRTPADLETHS